MLYTVIILLFTLENGLGDWKRLAWESCHHSTIYNQTMAWEIGNALVGNPVPSMKSLIIK